MFGGLTYNDTSNVCIAHVLEYRAYSNMDNRQWLLRDEKQFPLVDVFVSENTSSLYAVTAALLLEIKKVVFSYFSSWDEAKLKGTLEKGKHVYTCMHNYKNYFK